MAAMNGRIALRTRGLALLIAGALAGCGGGIYIGYNGGDGFDLPPQVSLVSSISAAAPGQTITLVAAASDDYGVDRVQFFRLDSDGSANSLGTDGGSPYQLQTTMPETSAASVRYFARAFDGAGQYNDSSTVTVTVLR